MATNKSIKEEAPQSVAEAINKSEQFLEKHKYHLVYAVVAVIVLVAAGFAYQRFVRMPKQQEAMGQMFKAEQYFRADSFALALNGDGNALGFLQVMDEYGKAAGKAAPFYAGVCELQLGEYEAAINHLKQYGGKDPIIAARALCCVGDAYVGLENLREALNYYLKAAHHSDNLYAAGYYKKAGIVCEELGDKAQALAHYTTIKDKYPRSLEAADIDKFISRLDLTK